MSTSTAFDRMVAALEQAGKQVKLAGNKATAQCPAHEDRDPSLSIARGNESVLVHCWAGCETPDVMAALGLGMADLYDNRSSESYRYADGVTVKRTYPNGSRKKQIRQSGTNTKAETTPLYHLEDVASAIESGATIWLTEGEKDADALRVTAGVIAISGRGGVSNFRKVDCTPLQNAQVIAVVDKDKPGSDWATQVMDKVGSVAASIKFVIAAEGAHDAGDHVTRYGLDAFVTYPMPEPDTRTRESSDDDKPERKSAATQLVELAQDRYRFGVTGDGQPFGVRPGHHVVRMLRGGQDSLRAELSRDYFRLHEKAAPQQALADALLVIEGFAQQEDPTEVHLRVAADKDAIIWVDLGDAAETAVRIDRDGWQTVTSGVPVLFRRTALTGMLPAPVNGDVDLLWENLNVTEDDRPLVLAWAVASIATPGVPHPIINLTGEQGTGKSTASRRLVSLVDPSPVPLRKPPRDQDSWVTAAQGSWVVGIDNMSTVPDWLSDSLCRASTGDGDVRRALYTDGGLAVFAFRRCVLLNGIDLGALRGDLADRMVLVQLERITERARIAEADLEARWEEDYPAIVGGLLTLCAGVISLLPSLRLASSPRMADFARVVAALDQLRGTDGLARLAEQAEVMAEDTLSSEPLLQALVDQHVDFVGTSTELLKLLTPADGAPKGWPKKSREVTTILKRNAPALVKTGWSVEQSKDGHSKVVVWTIRHPLDGGAEQHPQHPQHPQGGERSAPNRLSEPFRAAGVPAGVPAGVDRGHPQHPQRHPQPETAPIPVIAPISPAPAGVAGVADIGSGQSQDDGSTCRLHGTDYRPDACWTCERIAGGAA